MGFNTAKIAVGAGEILSQHRATARTTITPKAATTPTTTMFTCVTAEKNKLRKGDMLALASLSPTNLALEASAQPRITSIVANGSDWDVTVSPAFGSAPAAGSASVQLLYQDRGATDGDIVFEIEIDSAEQEVDQSMDIVALIKKSRRVKAMIPFAENTLENMALVAGMDPPSSSTALDIGDTTPGAARTDRLLLIVPGPDGLKRFIGIHQAAVAKGKASQKASKTNKSVFNGEFVAIPDSTMTPSVCSIKDA